MKIFFSGIGGSGVSALAGFFAAKGHQVAGSDRLFDRFPGHPLARRLQAGGIALVPQDGRHPDSSFDRVVFSTAVEKTNPEFRRAEELGLPLISRPDFLAEIVARHRTCAVAGTSGKSTVAGMLAYLMKGLGQGPNFLGGGRVKQFRKEDNPGNFLSGSSDLLIFEACESDGTLVSYRPSHSIILNLDLDHNPVADTARMFETLAGNTKERVLINADDPNLASRSFGKTVSFSLGHEADFCAVDVLLSDLGSSFVVHGVPFRTALPGIHNVSNALACIAFLAGQGFPLADISRILPGFSGIERRFDIHLNNRRYLVLDDYAHNPHKIAALMRVLMKISGNVCYIFQPHGFGPTRMLKNGYIDVFANNLREGDHLFLLPIYYAGGSASRDISSSDLVDGVVSAGKRASLLSAREDLFRLDLPYRAYAVFGARDDTLSDFAREIADNLETRSAGD